MKVEAVIFDLDGVLIDSEGVWDTARRRVASDNGGRWTPEATRAMIGMSSPEWSSYMHDELEVGLPPQEISDAVVGQLEELYSTNVPALPGARDAVLALARSYRLGLASSANRPIIDLVLERLQLSDCFAATVSAEEVPRGKPAPDVYLEAARRVGIEPAACIAVEDSANGIRSAASAGMGVVAVPNREFPPDPAALELADEVLDSLAELTPERIERG